METHIHNETPDGWQPCRIGDVTRRTQQRNPASTPERRFTYIDVSAVSNTSFRITEPTELLGVEAPSRARKIVHAGDVLFATVRPTLKRVALVPEHLHDQIASTGYIVLRPDSSKLDSRYLYFLLLTDGFMTRMRELERGASYPAVRDTDVLNEKISLPPLFEQQKISEVLGLVRRAIGQQEQQLALTAELKKTLLHQLFTRGLRGEPQKQTEIGPVPESWEVAKVEELVSRSMLAKPMDGNHGNIHPKSGDFVDEGIPFIMASDLRDGAIDLTGCAYLRKEQADRLQKGFAIEGDVLISHKATIGITAIVPRVENYMMLTPQVTYYRVLKRDQLNNVYLKAYFPHFEIKLSAIYSRVVL